MVSCAKPMTPTESKTMWREDKGVLFRDFPEIGWAVSIYWDEVYGYCVCEEVGSEELIASNFPLMMHAQMWAMEKAYKLATKHEGPR